MKSYSAKASELRLLIHKYAQGQLTMTEQQQLDAFMNRSPENASLVKLLISPEGPALLVERHAQLEKVWKGHSFQKILNKYKRKRRLLFPQLYLVVIIILLMVVGTGYFLVLLLQDQ